MKRLLCSLLLVAGCAGAPEPTTAETASRPRTPSALEDPWLAPDAGLVAAFKARFEALRGAPACQAALVRDEPEHAHALFLQAEQDPLLQALADAFARQREPQVAYLDSLRARRAAPDVHARGREALSRALALRAGDPDQALDAAEEAASAFAGARDPLWTAEAGLVSALVSRGALSGPPPARSVIQQVQAETLAAARRGVVLGGTTMGALANQRPPYDPAALLAEQARHATALERIEAMRWQEQPDAPSPWTRALCQAALERRLPLVALRHAATLVRDRADVPATDRLLVARAHQLAAQTEPALAEALQAVEDAKGARDVPAEAAAHALVAEVLIELGRPDAAVEEFDAAERLFLQAGDPDGRLRQAVNRAGVLVRLKRLDEADAALSPVRGLSLPGEEGADLACRRDVTAALLDLVSGRAGGEEAARRVEQALDIARAAGAYLAVERYVALPGRLRPGPG